MARIQPLDRADLAEFEGFFAVLEEGMGFVPKSILTMGRKPALLQAFAGMSAQVLGPGSIEPPLKSMIAFVASRAAGCQYCQAHTSHTAHRNGVDAAKIEASFEYETNELFSDRERAALRLAHHAGLTPNETTESDFEALRNHFDDDAIVEIVSVISLFGYLNRWNDTMATVLEDGPRNFAEETLSSAGWKVGRHAG